MARVITVIAVGLLFMACGAPPPSSGSARSAAGQEDARRRRCTDTVWSADHETADLSQWYDDTGGGEANSGAAVSSASEDVARSGRYSAKATITTPHLPDVSGVRLFRWKESRTYPEACYSAWYYFPQRYIAPIWWNVFQFKSRRGTVADDAFWSLQVGNRADGTMHVYLIWWGPPLEGPRTGQSGLQRFQQSLTDIPLRQWTHLEVYLRQSSGFDGQIIVWQDSVELFNLNNVRTRYADANGANHWSINNYSDVITPSPTTIYIDDAAISTPAVGRSPIGAVFPATTAAHLF